MSKEENASPERVESPRQTSSPADLTSFARHLHTKWNTPASRSNEERDTEERQEFQLRWEAHGSQLTNMVYSLEDDKASSDVTVVTKGASIPSHRLVLAAASPFFHHVLQDLPTTQHPVIVIKTANPLHLRYLISFCYRGTLTLHAHDIQQVLQLAEDLEIRGLKITLAEGSGSPSLAAFPALHTKLFCPTSPTRFPFTAPLQRSSSPSLNPLAGHDLSSGIKRSITPPDHKLMIKKSKVDPISYGEDKRPHSNPSYFYTPPGSAPPILPALPSSLFFNSASISPPKSAPPHCFGDSFAVQSSSPVPSDAKDQQSSGLSVVPPSSLLQPSSRSSSYPPSPQLEPSPSSPSPSPASINHQTPGNRSAKEPVTPSTPTIPSVKPEPGIGASSGSRVLLWRFLLDLLHDPHYSPIYIRWLDRSQGIFRIMESDMVAQLWGRARKNSNMNYEKMSRGMRTYYKRRILFHIDGTKLIYKFNTSDPEIEQRMKYHDFIQTNPDTEITTEQSTATSLPNTPAIPSTSASASASLESLYNPFIRDVSQMSRSFLYEPYISLIRASRAELY